MRAYYSRAASVTFAVLVLFIALSGCMNITGDKPGGTLRYVSYRDVPGVTADEINAVEEIRGRTRSFIYGMIPSTEMFYGETGEIMGYSALLCRWLTKLFDIPFEPAMYEWGDLISGLKSGSVDFTGDLTPTEERLKTYSMTHAISHRTLKYFRLAGSPPLSEISQTRPLRFAMFEGASTYNYIVSLKAYSEFEAMYVNDTSSAYELLKSGKADAFIVENVFEAAFNGFHDVVSTDFYPLLYNPVSFTASSLELKPFISIVGKALQNGGDSYLRELYSRGEQEYRRHKLYLMLDERERAYIRENPAVRFAAEHYNYPISFYNKYEQQWQGIFFDVMDEAAKLTGLSFKLVNDRNTEWPELFRLFESGEASMISELIPTRERQARGFLWPEVETLTDHYALLSKSETPNIALKDVLGVRVAIPRGTAYAEVFYSWFPNHPYAVEYESSDESFSALERGDVDMVISSRRRLLSITNYYEYPGYKENLVFDQTSASYIGFDKDEAVLCSIFSKVLSMIDIKGISEQWMRRTYDYKGKLVQAQRPWLFGASVLLLGVLILLFILFQRNRQEGRRLEILVEERTAEAEAANKAKSSFLTRMSHEIRTPMNAILGITETFLQNEELAFREREAFEKIHGSGNMLLGIINDILDLSKIEAGKLELAIAGYDIASLISDAVQLNIMRIGSKPVEFELYVDENIPSVLSGDALRVKQILNNILSNAFKYTAAGAVTLSVSSAETGEGNSGVTLIFRVSDTGQGMTPEQVSKLFDEYARFNENVNRATEGTGLGMNIVQKLVQMMNGEIFVESEPGKGSVFTVHLSQDKVDSAVLGGEMAENLQRFHASNRKRLKNIHITREQMPYGSVLIVDDVETNIYVARGLMAPYGLKIDSVDSGFAAVKKIRDGNVYDVIFMDHMMPEMGGIEAARRIREMGYEHPVVALTANAVVGQAELFFENGFDDFISKPIDIHRLNVVLNRLIRDKHLTKTEEAETNGKETGVQAQPAQPAVDPQFAEAFLRDARKAITALEEICAKQSFYDESDIRSYIINVHGIKSAIANLGRKELSAVAFSLEQAVRDGKTDVITSETPAFIDMLRTLAGELNQEIESANGEADTAAEDDNPYLREKLLEIMAACEAYDNKTAKAIITELREKAWTPPVKEMLGAIAEHLLHSEFDEAVNALELFIKNKL